MIHSYNILIGTENGPQYWALVRLAIHYPRLAKHIYNTYRQGKKSFDVKGLISINLI